MHTGEAQELSCGATKRDFWHAAGRLSMMRKASSPGTVSCPVSMTSGKCMAACSLRRSRRWNLKAALQDASAVPYSRSSRAKEYLSGPTLYAMRLRE